MKAQGAKLSTDGGKLGRELVGLFSIFCGLLLILSLATFDSRDPWLNHVVSGVVRVHNKAGLFGSYVAGLLYDILGAASWVFPALLCLAGVRRVMGALEWPWWRWTGFVLLALSLCLAGAASDLGDVEIFARGVLPQGSGNVSTHGGGIVGHMLYVAMVGWMSPAGAFLVWLFSLLLALQMLSGISLLALILAGGQLLRGLCANGLMRARDGYAKRREGRVLDVYSEERPRRESLPPLPVSVVPRDAEMPKRAEPTVLVLSDDDDEELPPAFACAEATPAAPAREVPASPERQPVTPPEPEPPLKQDFGDALVHPLVPRPQAEQPAHGPGSGAAGDIFHPASMPDFASMPDSASMPDAAPHAGDEEDDLPPWVRDFEEGRLGVQGKKVQEQPCLSDDADLLDILWGPEAPPETRTHDNTSSSALPWRDDLSHSAAERPATDQSLPLISTQTAAALDALRLAAASDPDDSLRSGPGALRLAEEGEAFAPSASFLDNAHGEAQPRPSSWEASSPEESVPSREQPVAPALAQRAGGAVAPQMQNGVPPVPAEAAPAPEPEYTGDVPIYEAPPVEQAPQPSLAQSVLQRVVKPSRVPLPSLSLLQAPPASSGGTPRAVLEEKGRALMTCLKDFGIQGELVGITPGPVVTMFEVRPAPGVRVSRIANLSDDLALALKAVAVRIQAPVPGTDTVGIEIPNEIRETVSLKELLASQAFQQSASLLTLAIGKDIAGHPAVADLATMPHLLVAGATGAGKSVGINSIILSFIYKARPEEVKLLLVDPKRVEMAIYADLPHLVHPVVTEMQLAKTALEWAVAEMEERYNAIAKAGVRNITDYNAKIASFGASPPEGMEDLVFMPYLVIIIDELADLMLVAAKEVETSIVRLAQLARAAGIHLILATQRPSVDVVTGLIKANFPCRMSFQVTSKHDSRTILDTVGAEHLLGKGDMLFKPSGGKFVRMHGAFVSDKDVNAVVDYWKSRQKPAYRIDFSDWSPEVSGGVLSGPGGNGGDVSSDPMYNEAVEFVRQQGKASISLIQRKFRIGFNKAARYVEQMEIDGIIGPADGSKPRLVIR